MWEPVGPLPAAVYWRRRLTAAATTLATLGLIVFGIVAVVAPDSDASDRATSRAAVTAPQPTAPLPAPAETSTPPSPGAGAPALDTSSELSPPPTPAPGTERLRQDDTPRSALPAPPPIPVPPTGPVPCADNMIGVAAEIDPVEHRVGQRPTLRLVVTNISDQPCVRDLDAARQEIVVWGLDGARLWSSNDCVNGSKLDLRTLVPGQPVAFAVTWAGRTSVPGCAAPRTVVPAGNYRLLSRVDGVISGPTDFRRLP